MEFPVKVRSRHASAARAGVFGVCGNSGDTVRFDFDAEWAAYPEKTAYFAVIAQDGRTETAVKFQGDLCPVPVIEKALLVEIGVTAGAIRTAAAARIPYAKCITDLTAEEQEPQQDLYSVLLSELMHQPVQRLCSGRYLVSAEGDYLATDAGDYLMTKE